MCHFASVLDDKTDVGKTTPIIASGNKAHCLINIWYILQLLKCSIGIKYRFGNFIVN